MAIGGAMPYGIEITKGKWDCGRQLSVSPFERGKEDLPCHCACHRTACPRMLGYRMGGAIKGATRAVG